jgi:hypothetical protein
MPKAEVSDEWQKTANITPIHTVFCHAKPLQTWVLPFARTTGEILPDISGYKPVWWWTGGNAARRPTKNR